jgi:hypothetical protein
LENPVASSAAVDLAARNSSRMHSKINTLLSTAVVRQKPGRV